MRRLIVCLVSACTVAVLTSTVAAGESGRGTMCVLHAKLAAKNETTGSTSVAKGHTLIKVRNDGAIEFKTQINNRNHETFVAGHIHQAAIGQGWEGCGRRSRTAGLLAGHGVLPSARSL